MTKRKIIIIILSFVLVVGGVAGYFIFRNNRKLNFDYQSGKIAYSKVTNAQYTPDLDKFIEINDGQAESYANNNTEHILSVSPLSNTQSVVINTEEEFSNLIDDYATIENYAGAGKYQGYDIYEIKNEIQYVVENVPAFNQWFRMPSMREEQGYISIPYYENWAYYIEMNDEILSITRVCWCTRSAYIDFDNKIIVEDHNDGSSFRQYEIMKTNYYVDTDGNEVVECYIYSVGIDNVRNGNHCNKNVEDYYPFEYQYLKNVKDKSLIKYHITVATRYSDSDSVMKEYSFDELNNSGMDIRGLNPYGVRREFIVANYDGYKNIEVMQIDQKFATLDYPYNNGEVSFDLNSDNIKMLISNIGLSQEDYQTSETSYDLMNKIAKQIIDNFEIKNNWADIYKESTDAIEVDIIKGPFYGKNLPVSYLRTRMSFYGNNEINGDIYATIVDPSLLEAGAEYSWSLALKSDSDIYIIATDYHKLENNVENLYLESDYSWKHLTDINIDKDGEYVLTVILTKKVDNYGTIEDKIVLDTQEPMFVIGHNALTIPNSIDNEGITHVYSCKSRCGKLTVTVTSQED